VGSSLIYVAIVAMWAGLLIPMWLRRHEQETEVRSVDRFSTAMRILSRRTPPPPDRRYLVMPQRPAAATLPVADVPRSAARRAAPPEPRPAQDRSEEHRLAARSDRPYARPAARRRPSDGKATAITRRRRVMIGLALVVFFTFAAALAGFVTWWWQFVADLALAGFVYHCRAEARRSTVMARRRRELKARRAATGVPVQARRVARAYEAVDVPPPAVVAETDAVGSGPLVIDEETWEPVPVPLPTYVTAPVAERPMPMTIDLTYPGSWSDAAEESASVSGSGEMESHEPLFDQEAFDDDFVTYADENELAELVQRRRAVND
jgi:hypothetical protein